MNIEIDSRTPRFLLTGGNMSYAFEISGGVPVHLYWGPAIDRIDDLPSADDRRQRRHAQPDRICNDYQEYPAFFGEFYGDCALKADLPGGGRGTKLIYDSCSVDGDLLTVILREAEYPLEVKLFYQLLPGLPLLNRWSEITNRGSGQVTLRTFHSAAWQMPAHLKRLTHLNGRWGKEAMLNRQELTHGRFVMESRTGLSGPFAVPCFALDDGRASELDGEVWFGTLQWAGNWKISVELDSFDHLAVTGGINDFDCAIPLPPGKSFKTPVFSGGHTAEGFSGASRVLHDYQKRFCYPQEVLKKPMPVLFNSWGSINIHVNEENILRAARAAADAGAELFVIDDGWQTFLGDWYPDVRKFPNGLRPVIEQVRSLGMEFGLWVEIESFETKSKLYHDHPEWAMQYPDRKPFVKRRDDVDRDSVMLDFSRREVAEYMYAALHELIRSTGISYLKLDMNCFFSSPGWRSPDGWVRYVENLLSVFERLHADFPLLLMENCAAGAGRPSLAMTRFFGRMNRSDNQDTRDVLKLHEGFTFLHLPRMAGGACHISDSIYGINLRRTPLKFQAYCGMLGSLAIGKNLPACTPEEIAEIRSYTDLYKQIRNVTNFADFYRLECNDSYDLFAYLAEDRSEAYIFALGASLQFGDPVPPFRVPDLIPDAVYRVEYIGVDPQTACMPYASGKTISGRGAANIGLQVELLGDYDCKLIHLKKC